MPNPVKDVLFVISFVCVGISMYYGIQNIPDPKSNKPQMQYIYYTADMLADAIYWSEGGPKASQPYGINPKYKRCDNERACREVCMQTILRNRTRYQKYEETRKSDPGNRNEYTYLEFLADRYCPASEDLSGNKNWKINVKYFLRNPKGIK